MDCNACKQALKTKDYIKCRLCVSKFHCECLNIDVREFRAYTKEYKSAWVCPLCINVTKRSRTNDSTPVPVRSRNTPSQYDNNVMNMSCDAFDPNANITHSEQSSGADLTPQLGDTNVEVTMENISALLDVKLNASRLEFMESLRKTLREDVKEMVKHELGSTIQNLKDDFSATTDFISNEQASLRTDINKSVIVIKNLEMEKNKLQAEVARLNARLIGIEKISRSCNVEIQAVPESKNENLMGLFRKLCDVIKLPMDDGQINACRRVAKHNSTSSRPRNIVVTFATPRIRDTVLSAAHRYVKAHPGRGLTSIDLGITGETRRIFVTEHLSPEQKSLHAATRQTAKERGYKYVWVKYGQIYARKNDTSGAVLIKDLDSLNKLS